MMKKLIAKTISEVHGIKYAEDLNNAVILKGDLSGKELEQELNLISEYEFKNDLTFVCFFNPNKLIFRENK